MTSNATENTTCKLSDIATIKEIKLHEIKAEDLLVTNKFRGAWNNFYAGSENACPTYLAGLLDSSPRFLDSLNLGDVSKRNTPINTLPRQHLDFFVEEPKDEVKNAEHSLNGEYNLPEYDSLPPVLIFLHREEWVLRLKEEWRERLLPEYVQKQVEENLPGLLEKLRPAVTFDPGCSIPNRTNPTTQAELYACPIEVVPLEEQINLVDTQFSTIEVLDNFLRPLHQGLDDILVLLTSEGIGVNELLNRCRTVASLPEHFEQPPWVFAQELCRCLESLTKASEGLKKNPDNKAARQLIAAYENLEQFLIKNGPWAERENPATLFARIVVARLRLALPNTSATIAAAEKQREAENKAEEREAVLRELSDHIKNSITSAVIDPMMWLRRQQGDNIGIINKALRGADLLREIVNAACLSDQAAGTRGAVKLALSNEDGRTLGEIFEDGLRSAFANMFDGKYFREYYSIHFPTRENFYGAKDEFLKIEPGDIQALLTFGRKYLMGEIEWVCEEEILARKISVTESCAVKMAILFRVLLLNTVRAATIAGKTLHDRRIGFFASDKKGEIKVIIKCTPLDRDPPSDIRISATIADNLLKQFKADKSGTEPDKGILQFILPIEREARNDRV